MLKGIPPILGPDLLHIWDGNELLKTALRDNTKEVRKKRASVATQVTSHRVV